DKEIKIVSHEQVEKLEKCLEILTPKLGELYAKNRNLITLPEHRKEFEKVKGQYGAILDECLKLKAREVYNDEEVKISQHLETRLEEFRQEIEELLLDFAGGDLENTDKTQEELDAKKAELVENAHQMLCEEWAELKSQQEAKVNAAFLKDFLTEQAKLEDATVDALKNGNFVRKVVDKILNNKTLKIALAGAAVAGLAVTGIGFAAGVAAGTTSIGLSFTAGGVAAGAGKGALMGALMSRQSAEKSAVNQFATKEAMTSEFEKIAKNNDATESANVAGWLLEQYSKANTKDQSTNRKRTLISAGLGAVVGGIMSGVKINNITSEEVTTKKFVGHESVTETHSPDLIDQVNIPEGSGYYTTFEQLGGNPENYEQATEALLEVGKKYGFERVNNPLVVDGPFAITHPGKIADWPAEAQSFINEVAKAWADQGLVSRSTIRTVGAPVYDPITKVVTNIVPDAFREFIARAVGLTTVAAAGSFIGGMNQPAPESTPEPEPEEPEEPKEPESEPEEPEELEESEELEPTAYDEAKSALSNHNVDKVIGEDGVEFITAEPVALTPGLTARFALYWSTLDDGKKQVVTKLIRSLSLPENAFYEWLTSEGVI
ncbi:hypothetical protein IKF03_00820, partial [Candidatus Saccharibacteria bacterium]|nr:hypothetical protein [Candidatus Saccharibacteria bacterium]